MQIAINKAAGRSATQQQHAQSAGDGEAPTQRAGRRKRSAMTLEPGMTVIGLGVPTGEERYSWRNGSPWEVPVAPSLLLQEGEAGSPRSTANHELSGGGLRVGLGSGSGFRLGLV